MAPCFHAENMHLLEPLLSWSDVRDVIYIMECRRGMCLQVLWSKNPVSIVYTICIALYNDLNTFFFFFCILILDLFLNDSFSIQP